MPPRCRLIALSVFFALMVGLCAIPIPTSSGAATCTAPKPGSWRWNVKTLADRDARRVASAPQDVPFATLMDLAKAGPSRSLSMRTPRIAPVELTIYRVRARLMQHKMEDDNDFHIVIAAPSNLTPTLSTSNLTMIAEIPDPGCAGGSANLAQIRAVRQAYVAAHGQPRRGQPSQVRGLPMVTVTGVGFFDECGPGHQPAGHSPNCLELHPVLDISE